MKVFVLIETTIGRESEVLKDLGKLPYVKEAYSLYGVYDVIAKIETEDEENLYECVKGIREIDRIRRTQTLIVQ